MSDLTDLCDLLVARLERLRMHHEERLSRIADDDDRGRDRVRVHCIDAIDAHDLALRVSEGIAALEAELNGWIRGPT